MIEVKNLSYRYDKEREILKKIEFKVGEGEVVSLLGPNGCGKSTLLKIILGFLRVSKGLVFIDGVDVNDITRQAFAAKLSYVPQSHRGVFSYTALEVVLMGRFAKSPWINYTEEDYEEARKALERLRMLKLAERPYLHLSGGERQLVLIARALAQGAGYFLMDEPVTGLDYGNQFRLLEAVKELAGSGLTFILTTHHPEHAVFLGGRALLLKEGELIGDGSPYEVITTNCLCNLYNMPRKLVEQFSDMHFKRD